MKCKNNTSLFPLESGRSLCWSSLVTFVFVHFEYLQLPLSNAGYLPPVTTVWHTHDSTTTLTLHSGNVVSACVVSIIVSLRFLVSRLSRSLFVITSTARLQ